MRWVEYTLDIEPAAREAVEAACSRFARNVSVEEIKGSEALRVRAYLPKSARRRRVDLEIALELLAATAGVAAYTVREVTPEDWGESWKVHFPLQRVGKRLVIKPSWATYEAVEGDVVLHLDPGMGFGTGHHATTRLCLELLEATVKPGMRVLDAGTGSGILALAALKLGAASAVALDIDVDAVREARANLRREGLTKRVRVIRASLPHRAVEAGTFDVAVMNIHVRACHELIGELVAALRPGGAAIVSGFREDDAQSVLVRAKTSGLQITASRESEGWSGFAGVKPTGTSRAS